MTTNLNIGNLAAGISVTVPPPADPPDAPVLTAGTITPTTVSILWATPDNGGSPITGYNIYAAPSGSDPTLVEAISPANSYLLNGLLSNTEYDFYIEAVNAAGTSDPSNTLTVETLPIGDPPDAPVLALRGATATTISVTWDTPAAEDGPVLGYRLYKARTGETLELVATVPPAHGFTFQNLLPSTEYDFALVAYNVMGDSDPSETLTAETDDSDLGALGAPWITRVTVGDTTAHVLWATPLPPGEGSEVVTGHNIYLAPHGEPLVLIDSPSVSEFDFADLDPTTVYDVAAESILAGYGTTPRSEIVSFSTNGAPTAPVLTSLGVTTTKVTVGWAPPSPGGSPITSYKVYAALHGLTQVLVATIPGSASAYVFTGLTPDTEYDFSIEAVNDFGTGPRSATLTRSTLPEVPDDEAPFHPFPGAPIPPPRYVRARLWDTDMTNLVTELPRAHTIHVEDVWNGIGGGSFVMPTIGDDGEADPTVAEVVGGRIVQTMVWDEDDETYDNAYLWRMEVTPKVTVAPTDGARVISPTGRGVAQDFEAVQVDPYGGPGKVPWGDERSFGWQAPELLDNGTGGEPWVAPHVRSIQCLKSGFPPYGLCGKPYGWPNPLSPWLWGIAPTSGHDEPGFSYFRYRFTLFRSLDVTFYVTADDLFVASLNDVDIMDFQTDKGDAAGTIYYRKFRLEPGDYVFACRVENETRPGIAENCGLFNMCATYGISPEPTTPWNTMDTQRFLFSTAGWSAETFDPPGFYIEAGSGPTGLRTVAYTTATYHNTQGVRVGDGFGTVVEPGDLAPAGTYVEASSKAGLVKVVVYPTETVHTAHGVEVGPSPYGTDAVGYGHPLGWRSRAYPAQAPGMTPGSILNYLLYEAKLRGELLGWGWTFNDLLDSAGNPWPEFVREFQCRVGTSYTEVFAQLEEQGYINWDVSPDGLILNVYAKSTDLGLADTAFVEGENILRLEHADKWGLRRDKALARTKEGWVRRGSGARQMTLSIPDWTETEKINRYLDEQIARTANDASSATLEFVPVDASVTPFVGFRNGRKVTMPDSNGDSYTPRVVKCVIDERKVGPPASRIEFESPSKVSEQLLAKVQNRTAPGAFDGRSASIAPFAKSQPQGGELRLVEIKFNLSARADGAATNAISDGLTYADSGDERPPGRFKLCRAQLTAGSLQVEEDPYEGVTIVQLLYNGYVGQTMALGPGEFESNDFFGSGYVNPLSAHVNGYPNWYLETGPLDTMKVQLVEAGTHRNLVYTVWGYEIP